MALNRLYQTTAFRLIAIYLLVLIIASVGIGGYMAWKTNTLITKQLVETIQAEVKGLAEQFRLGGQLQLAATINRRSRRPGNSLYYFGTAAGLKHAGNINRIPANLIQQTGGAEFEYIWQFDEEREKRHAIGVPFHVAGNLILVVGRDIEANLEFINAARTLFFTGLGALALFGVGAGLWVSRNLLNRITLITNTSKSIMAGDLKERIPLRGSGDELDRLSANLNTMLARIETLVLSMRNVTDNIAHDLKTPINRMRIGAEQALLDKDNPKAATEALHTTIEEADNLIKTFNSILKIARLEAGAESEVKDEVNLSQVLEELAELYEPLIDEAGLQLNLQTEENLIILADRQLISQAIANLIDNAIKYAAPAPEKSDIPDSENGIELICQSKHGRATVIIADQGEGIGDQDRKRVLERFVRLEESRNKPGSGLGLSLVAAIANAYKGTIALKDNKPGLRVELSFPLSPSPV